MQAGEMMLQAIIETLPYSEVSSNIDQYNRLLGDTYLSLNQIHHRLPSSNPLVAVSCAI